MYGLQESGLPGKVIPGCKVKIHISRLRAIRNSSGVVYEGFGGAEPLQSCSCCRPEKRHSTISCKVAQEPKLLKSGTKVPSRPLDRWRQSASRRPRQSPRRHQGCGAFLPRPTVTKRINARKSLRNKPRTHEAKYRRSGQRMITKVARPQRINRPMPKNQTN